MPSFLINRDFARLWFGQAVSTVGDYVFDTTLVVWVAKVLYGTDARVGPLAIGGLVLCTVVATFVVGPMAGVFVDRWSHRRIMLRSEVIRFVLVGALAVTMFVVHVNGQSKNKWAWLVLLYSVVFLVQAAEQFFNPARFATIGDVVEGDVDRARAFGLGSATSATAAIIGPPLAAPLLIVAGIQWALLFNALSYLVSFAAIRSVRFRARADEQVEPQAGEPAVKPSWRSEFGAGVRMFARNRFLVSLAIIAVFAQLGTGPISTLDIYYIREDLHSSQNLIGFLSTAMGAGAIVGGLIAGRVVRKINARNTTWLGVILAGVLILVIARQTNFYAGLVAIFLMFIPITALNTAISPQLLAVTPKEYLGRMMSIFSPLVQLSSTLSIVLSSSLAATVLLHFHPTIGGLHVGRIDTLYSAGGLIIVAAGIYAYFRLPPASVSAAGDVIDRISAPSNPLEPVDLAIPATAAADGSDQA